MTAPTQTDQSPSLVDLMGRNWNMTECFQRFPTKYDEQLAKHSNAIGCANSLFLAADTQYEQEELCAHAARNRDQGRAVAQLRNHELQWMQNQASSDVEMRQIQACMLTQKFMKEKF